MMLLDQSEIGPPSMGIQRVAIYDSTGTPVDFTADADDTGADVLLTGYSANAYSAVAETDSVNTAVAKLEDVAIRGSKVVTLSNSGTNVAVNAALGRTFVLTLTASTWTIKNPTNPVDGQMAVFRLVQDSTGSRTVTWDTAYSFGGGSAPTLTTTASKTDFVVFTYDSALSKWCYLYKSLAF
jgi:hypothetical protein